jgi:hypothetical protein
MKEEYCSHKRKRLRKNYPFGRKSEPVIHCLDCGEVIKRKELPGKSTNKKGFVKKSKPKKKK